MLSQRKIISGGLLITGRLRVEITVEHGKNPTFLFFIWLNNNHKERLDLKIFYNN